MVASNKNPSDTWFFNDWENDVELKSCSDAAQGIWMRMLCIMARSPERGVLILGDFPADRKSIVRPLANYLGRTEQYIDGILTELLQSRTASLDEAGRVINRRMVRARAISEKRSRAGRAGAQGRWQTDGKIADDPGNLDEWQDHGKHHGKADGKSPQPQLPLSHGEIRENGHASPQIGCDVDGKPMASSFLQDSLSNGESLTEERGRASRATAQGADGKNLKRRTRLSEDWTLSDHLRSWTTGTLSATNAVGRVDIERELEKFRAHHIAKGSTMVSWDRAWHTWIFNAIEWSERSEKQRAGAPRRQSGNNRLNNFYSGWSGKGDPGPATAGEPGRERQDDLGPELVGTASMVDTDGPTEQGQDGDGPDVETGR